MEGMMVQGMRVSIDDLKVFIPKNPLIRIYHWLRNSEWILFNVHKGDLKTNPMIDIGVNYRDIKKTDGIFYLIVPIYVSNDESFCIEGNFQRKMEVCCSMMAYYIEPRSEMTANQKAPPQPQGDEQSD